MPKAFKKEFRTNGCTAHIRKRKCGKNNYTYETIAGVIEADYTTICRNEKKLLKAIIAYIKK